MSVVFLIFLAGTVTVLAGGALTQPGSPGSSGTFRLPPGGIPGYIAMGQAAFSLASKVQATPEFHLITKGVNFSVVPDRSFGGEWGPNIPSASMITFFSPDGRSYLEALVIISPAHGSTSVNSSQIASIAVPMTNSSSVFFWANGLSLGSVPDSGPTRTFSPVLVYLILTNATDVVYA